MWLAAGLKKRWQTGPFLPLGSVLSAGQQHFSGNGDKANSRHTFTISARVPLTRMHKSTCARHAHCQLELGNNGDSGIEIEVLILAAWVGILAFLSIVFDVKKLILDYLKHIHLTSSRKILSEARPSWSSFERFIQNTTVISIFQTLIYAQLEPVVRCRL